MKRQGRYFLKLLLLHVLATRCLAGDLTLKVNIRKPIAVTDQRFLSLAVDPVNLLAGNALSADFEKSINLARALTPAYMRLGGPGSSLHCFSDQNSQSPGRKRKIVLTESDLTLTHQWAERAGLDVIACISPDDRQKMPDATEAIKEIISFADAMRLDAHWQLGYECQGRCKLSANDFANRTLSLRELLNEIPRYANSILVGPDVVAYATKRQQDYLKKYLEIAGPALSAITWHPDLNDVALGNDGVFIRHDNLERDKEELLQVIGPLLRNQPLWIAESKPEECKSLYIGALVLARRLGNAAKLNVNVVLRQPADLTKPSPDYWVSLLHKHLVGQVVFDTKIQSGDESHVYLYCQCTRTSDRYSRGSITLFGVNLSPENAEINLKGTKITTVHQYLILPGVDAANRMFAETVLLNNVSLSLINDTVPLIDPAILNDPNGMNLTLPSAGIGFWVFPNLKVKSCMENEDTSGRASPRVRVPRDLRKPGETRASRPLLNRASRQSARKERTDERVARKPHPAKETEKLKKLLKRRLDDYDSKSLLKVRGLSDSDRDGPEDPESRDTPRRHRNGEWTSLQEFKDLFKRIRLLAANGSPSVVRGPVAELEEKMVDLLNQMQATLGDDKLEYSRDTEMRLTMIMRDCLRTLYEMVLYAQLSESINSEVEKIEQQSGASKRRQFKRIPSWNPSTRSRSKRQAWRDNAGESGIDERTADAKEVAGPYFMETLEQFPEEEALAPAGDAFSPADYGTYPESEDPRTDGAARMDHDDIWFEADLYETARFVPAPTWSIDRGGSVLINGDPRKPSYSPKKMDRLEREKGPGTTKVPTGEGYLGREDLRSSSMDYHLPSGFVVHGRDGPVHPSILPERTIYGIQRSSDPGQWTVKKTAIPDFNAGLRGLPFSIAGDFDGSTRFRRAGENFEDLLNREMIQEDAGNAKDCRCRVPRSDDRSDRALRISREGSISPRQVDDLRLESEEASAIDDSPAVVPVVRAETTAVQFDEDAAIPATSSTELEETHTEPTIFIVHAQNSTSESDRKTQSPPLDTDEEETFFRDEIEKGDEEDTASITASRSAAVEEASASTLGEATPASAILDQEITEEAKRTEEVKILETRSPPKVLSEYSTEKIVAEESSDRNATAGVNAKREVGDPEEHHGILESVAISKPQPSTRKTPKKKPAAAHRKPVLPSHKTKPKKRKVLKSFAKMLRESSKPSLRRSRFRKVKRNEEARKRRAGEVLKLKKKLRDRRQSLLKQCQGGSLGIGDNVEEGERKNLTRREALEKVQETDEFRDLVNREKLAYYLMYQPSDYDSNAEEASGDEEEEDAEASVTTVAPSRNLRKRTHHSSGHKGRPLHEKQRDLQDLKRKIEQLSKLKSLLAGNKERDKAQEVKDQEISRYHENHEETITDYYVTEKPHQVSSTQEPRCSTHEIQEHRSGHREDHRDDRYKHHRDDSQTDHHKGRSHEHHHVHHKVQHKAHHRDHHTVQHKHPHGDHRSAHYDDHRGREPHRYSNREEESHEDADNREIYIIDPSEYKGGAPLVKLYRDSSARGNLRNEQSHKSRESPTAQKYVQTRQTDRKIFVTDRGDASGTPRDFLKIVIDGLDSQTVRDLVKHFETEHATDVTETTEGLNEAETVGEELAESDTSDGGIEEPTAQEVSKADEDLEDEKSIEIFDAVNVREQRGGPPMNSSAEEEARAEERSERNSTASAEEVDREFLRSSESPEEKSREEDPIPPRRRTSSPTFYMRKLPRAIQSTGPRNYLHSPEVPREIGREDSSKLLEILTGSDLNTSFEPSADVAGNREDLENDQSDSEYLETTDAEDPRGTLTEEYADSGESGWLEGGIEEAELEDYADEDTSSSSENPDEDAESVAKNDESIEDDDLEKLLFSEKPELVVVLPSRSSRYRREAVPSQKMEGSTETVQSDLQRLEEPRTERTSTLRPVDDVEESLVQKLPLESYKTKGDIKKKRPGKAKKQQKTDDSFPSIIEKAIPKLENVVVDGLKRAQNFTGSVGQLIENIDEKFNETTSDPGESFQESESLFRNAIVNVKKFFMLFRGITHLIRA